MKDRKKIMSMLILLLTTGRSELNLVTKPEHTHVYPMKTQRRTARSHTSSEGGKRNANKEKNRQSILKAALALFAEKGFYRTTTKAISRKANIAEGTLFNYFRTKEDLALYFFERELSGMMDW